MKAKKFIQFICENFCKRLIPKPKITGNISITALATLLSLNGIKNIYLADKSYDLCPVGEASRFLALDRTDLKDYKAEVADCDDFSRELWHYWKDWQSTLAFGIAWSGTHAFNIFVDDKKEVWIVEPQADRLIKLSLAKQIRPKYWPIRMVVI